MSLSDPIADMLTRIRNAYRSSHEVVEMPGSRLKSEIARILKKEGYVTDYVVEGGTKRILRVYLKYTQDREPVIRGLRRQSRPGLRKYVGWSGIPLVLGGFGTVILSTPNGMMTGKEARKQKVGGEYICSVW